MKMSVNASPGGSLFRETTETKLRYMLTQAITPTLFLVQRRSDGKDFVCEAVMQTDSVKRLTDIEMTADLPGVTAVEEVITEVVGDDQIEMDFFILTVVESPRYVCDVFKRDEFAFKTICLRIAETMNLAEQRGIVIEYNINSVFVNFYDEFTVVGGKRYPVGHIDPTGSVRQFWRFLLDAVRECGASEIGKSDSFKDLITNCYNTHTTMADVIYERFFYPRHELLNRRLIPYEGVFSEYNER